jgi:integrase
MDDLLARTCQFARRRAKRIEPLMARTGGRTRGSTDKIFWHLPGDVIAIVRNEARRLSLRKGRDGQRQTGGLGFHCLRYTATSYSNGPEFSDVVAREIVGHETAAVSRIYSHLDTATLRAAIDKLPDLSA